MIDTPKTMPRFVAIDGLRAWMAWVVVATHAIQQSIPLSLQLHWMKTDWGGYAVDVFIIISGFVITHLLIENPSKYSAYLIARFMRLFPAFAICCMLGFGTAAFAASKGETHWFETVQGSGWKSLTSHFMQHAAAHVTMLHGIIPNSVLPESEYAFIPPGWSVSLEWQFYLLAPLLINMKKTSNLSIIIVAALVFSSILYHFGLKEFWDRPSIFFGASKIFLIGIFSRFAAPYLAGMVKFTAATALGLGYTAFWAGVPSLAIWIVVYAFIIRNNETGIAIDRHFVNTMQGLLESRWIKYLADRSYSTYLLHWPVMTLIGAIATSYGVRFGYSLLFPMLLAIPITFLLQIPMYRYVEEPARRLGKQWAQWLGADAILEIPKDQIARHSLAARHDADTCRTDKTIPDLRG